MQSRMDKYSSNDAPVLSRTEKNKNLYESVKTSALTAFDINSNMAVIDNHANHIDVNKVQKMLDKRYNSDAPKRRSIELPQMEEPVVEDVTVDTKEYDINAILAKAKQGKNVDYNKERLKKVREAQFEILNNLDLELKKVEEPKNNHKNKEAEENLMNLINTITELEIRNKTSNYNKEVSEALDLLSDLKDSDDIDDDIKEDTDTVTEIKIEEEVPEKEEHKDATMTQAEIKLIKEVPADSDMKTGTIQMAMPGKEMTDKEREQQTLTKLNINRNNYDDFSDISRRDGSSLVIKIILFIVIIALIIGAVYILDSILGLGLF